MEDEQNGQQANNGEQNQQGTPPTPTPTPTNQQVIDVKDTPEYKALAKKLSEVTEESIKRKEKLRQLTQALGETDDMAGEQKPAPKMPNIETDVTGIDPNKLVDVLSNLVDSKLQAQMRASKLDSLKVAYKLSDQDIAAIGVLPDTHWEDFAKRLAPPGVVDSTSRGNPSGGEQPSALKARLEANWQSRHGADAPSPFDANIHKAQGGGVIKT